MLKQKTVIKKKKIDHFIYAVLLCFAQVNAAWVSVRDSFKNISKILPTPKIWMVSVLLFEIDGIYNYWVRESKNMFKIKLRTHTWFWIFGTSVT